MCLRIRIEDYILSESLFLDVTDVLMQKRWTGVNKATSRLILHDGGGAGPAILLPGVEFL